MLDDRYLYKRDFDRFYEKFQKLNLNELYKGLYSHGRLLERKDLRNTQDYNEFVLHYNQSLKIISDLVKDNHELQNRVHELGIKNRLRRKLGRLQPLENQKSYVSSSELKDIFDGSFVDKNYMPLVPFSKESLELFKSLSSESFESGLRAIQGQISTHSIKKPPLVSIIILTRNGLEHLERLFANFDKLTGYSNYEVIVVDNASQDSSKKYLEQLKTTAGIEVIYNTENKSFSESNNRAVLKSKGSYLLFLNNDVLPTKNWLNHMMQTAVKHRDLGAIGAKLVYPFKEGFDKSYKIQHGGLGFRIENDFIRPVNMAVGSGFFTRNTSLEEEKAGVTAACMLIERQKFNEVGGFDEAYWYGYEDVDLCLKLREKGYRNVINNASVLFHYEFGTQSKLSDKTIVNYRKKNMQVFKNTWFGSLYPKIWKSIIEQDGIYTDKLLHVAFVVTESSEKTAAGDYFTAKELGSALQKKGCIVSYIGILDSEDPYEINNEVDIVISMVDNYDVNKISSNRPIKIAWCRNWFDRWAERDYFRSFDIVLTSSEIAKTLFKETYFVDSHLFKIATNIERFTHTYSEEELSNFKSDICFTGNYWQVPRDISKLFDAKNLDSDITIKIYGKDWDQVKELSPYWQGFLDYKDIPKVYASGKILIDDAIFTTNKWGSVNSRVFDGIASGALVLTNGIKGSENTFNGLLPTYSTREELSTLLNKYLGNEGLRLNKINELREIVLNNHTYDHRANQLLEILKQDLTKNIVNIKLPLPNWDQAKEWGDLYFGLGLKSELEKQNLRVSLQNLSEWNKPNFAIANIVLRGLSIFDTPTNQLNIMWNISHPDKVSLNEYRSYDYAFVASLAYKVNLGNKGLKNIQHLNQCFDESVFNTTPALNPEKYKSDILFVGNTRSHFRKIVKDVLSWEDLSKYRFKVYGKGWEKFIDHKYIAGEFIENAELKYYYQNTKILLNDHWEDMNRYAFVSNRLFDASACSTFVISDSNPGIKDIFGEDVIQEYTTASSLHNLLNRYLKNDKERNIRAKKANSVVLNRHTFTKRTAELLEWVKELR